MHFAGAAKRDESEFKAYGFVIWNGLVNVHSGDTTINTMLEDCNQYVV
jgi:hypothetical protein